MTQPLATVAVLPSSAMAGIVRQQLEAENIEVSTVEADGNFELRVAEADFARAMQLLFPVPGSTPGAAAPWKCAHCGEEVQPISDTCWACGKPRADAATAAASEQMAPSSGPPPPPSIAQELAPPAVAREGGGQPANSPKAAVSSPPQARPPRARTPEPRQPRDPWLIALWALIVIAIIVIAWLALK